MGSPSAGAVLSEDGIESEESSDLDDRFQQFMQPFNSLRRQSKSPPSNQSTGGFGLGSVDSRSPHFAMEGFMRSTSSNDDGQSPVWPAAAASPVSSCVAGWFGEHVVGGEAQLDADGGEAQSDANGGEAQLDADGGEAQLDADGGEAQSDANGGEAQLDADGGEAQLDADGGEAQLDADGGEAQLNADGGEAQSPDQFADVSSSKSPDLFHANSSVVARGISHKPLYSPKPPFVLAESSCCKLPNVHAESSSVDRGEGVLHAKSAVERAPAASSSCSPDDGPIFDNSSTVDRGQGVLHANADGGEAQSDADCDQQRSENWSADELYRDYFSTHPPLFDSPLGRVGNQQIDRSPTPNIQDEIDYGGHGVIGGASVGHSELSASLVDRAIVAQERAILTARRRKSGVDSGWKRRGSASGSQNCSAVVDEAQRMLRKRSYSKCSTEVPKEEIKIEEDGNENSTDFDYMAVQGKASGQKDSGIGSFDPPQGVSSSQKVKIMHLFLKHAPEMLWSDDESEVGVSDESLSFDCANPPESVVDTQQALLGFYRNQNGSVAEPPPSPVNFSLSPSLSDEFLSALGDLGPCAFDYPHAEWHFNIIRSDSSIDMLLEMMANFYQFSEWEAMSPWAIWAALQCMRHYMRQREYGQVGDGDVPFFVLAHRRRWTEIEFDKISEKACSLDIQKTEPPSPATTVPSFTSVASFDLSPPKPNALNTCSANACPWVLPTAAHQSSGCGGQMSDSAAVNDEMLFRPVEFYVSSSNNSSVSGQNASMDSPVIYQTEGDENFNAAFTDLQLSPIVRSRNSSGDSGDTVLIARSPRQQVAPPPSPVFPPQPRRARQLRRQNAFYPSSRADPAVMRALQANKQGAKWSAGQCRPFGHGGGGSSGGRRDDDDDTGSSSPLFSDATGNGDTSSPSPPVIKRPPPRAASLRAKKLIRRLRTEGWTETPDPQYVAPRFANTAARAVRYLQRTNKLLIDQCHFQSMVFEALQKIIGEVPGREDMQLNAAAVAVLQTSLAVEWFTAADLLRTIVDSKHKTLEDKHMSAVQTSAKRFGGNFTCIGSDREPATRSSGATGVKKLINEAGRLKLYRVMDNMKGAQKDPNPLALPSAVTKSKTASGIVKMDNNSECACQYHSAPSAIHCVSAKSAVVERGAASPAKSADVDVSAVAPERVLHASSSAVGHGDSKSAVASYKSAVVERGASSPSCSPDLFADVAVSPSCSPAHFTTSSSGMTNRMSAESAIATIGCFEIGRRFETACKSTQTSPRLTPITLPPVANAERQPLSDLSPSYAQHGLRIAANSAKPKRVRFVLSPHHSPNKIISPSSGKTFHQMQTVWPRGATRSVRTALLPTPPPSHLLDFVPSANMMIEAQQKRRALNGGCSSRSH